MVIANSDSSFLCKIKVLFFHSVHHITFISTEFPCLYNVQSHSIVLSFAILQSTFIFAAVNNSVFISELCHLLFTFSRGQLRTCRTAQAAAWITVALQGSTSVKTHCLPPLCVSDVYSVIYPYEDLPSYLRADYFVLPLWWRILLKAFGNSIK